MTHPLVEQLRFTRSEFQRGLKGLPDADAERRLAPMNSIAWIVGHMTWQEQRYWLTRGQQQTPLPELNRTVASGKPMSTPGYGEMREAWQTITKAADPWLDELGQEDMERIVVGPRGGSARTIGNLLRRTTYHYWFHTGEILAIRQIMGHGQLPEFVGAIDDEAPYRPERG